MESRDVVDQLERCFTYAKNQYETYIKTGILDDKTAVAALLLAIWIRALGLASASDFSRFPIAVTWQSLKPSVIRGGTVRSFALSVSLSDSHSLNVSGLWKANTLLDHGSGSL
jgi:hypothetical protein